MEEGKEDEAVKVMDMVSGPELNALVAERVMGWILPPYSDVVGQMWVEPPLGIVHPEGPPPYSSDWTAMGKVIERVKRRDFALTLTWVAGEPPSYGARFGTFYGGFASHPALPVCKAALLACGIEEV